MPRSDEPDAASTKEQSPEPTPDATPAKEMSPSPELCQDSEARGTPEGSSAKVQSPDSKEEKDFSAESVDDEGGSSVRSDTLSGDSVCSKCGRSKRGKNSDLKPTAQSTCKCNLQKDELKDVEYISLQEIPLADVAAEEIAPIDNNDYDQLPDLPGESSPEQQITPSHEEQGRQNQPGVVGCLNNSCDVSCDNCNWPLVIVIVVVIAMILCFFLYLLVAHSIRKASKNGNFTNNNNKE